MIFGNPKSYDFVGSKQEVDFFSCRLCHGHGVDVFLCCSIVAVALVYRHETRFLARGDKVYMHPTCGTTKAGYMPQAAALHNDREVAKSVNVQRQHFHGNLGPKQVEAKSLCETKTISCCLLR